MKRSRGRGRRQQNPVNRSYDSNGPDVRVRGTASQVYEKYQALARDAMSAGDRVMAENYQQHAEHYYRILQSLQPTPSETERENDGEANNEEAAGTATNATNGADSADAASAAGTTTNGAEPLVLVREEGDEAAKPEGKSRRRGPLGKKRGGKSTNGASNKSAAEGAAEETVEAPVETAKEIADTGDSDAPVSAE